MLQWTGVLHCSYLASGTCAIAKTIYVKIQQQSVLRLQLVTPLFTAITGKRIIAKVSMICMTDLQKGTKVRNNGVCYDRGIFIKVSMNFLPGPASSVRYNRVRCNEIILYLIC